MDDQPHEPFSPQTSRPVSWAMASVAMIFSGAFVLGKLPDAASKVHGSFGGIGVLIDWFFAVFLSGPLSVIAVSLNRRSLPRDEEVPAWRLVEMLLVLSPPLVVSLIIWLYF